MSPSTSTKLPEKKPISAQQPTRPPLHPLLPKFSTAVGLEFFADLVVGNCISERHGRAQYYSTALYVVLMSEQGNLRMKSKNLLVSSTDNRTHAHFLLPSDQELHRRFKRICTTHKQTNKQNKRHHGIPRRFHWFW